MGKIVWAKVIFKMQDVKSYQHLKPAYRPAGFKGNDPIYMLLHYISMLISHAFSLQQVKLVG
jgi:hypothetical protein